MQTLDSQIVSMRPSSDRWLHGPASCDHRSPLTRPSVLWVLSNTRHPVAMASRRNHPSTSRSISSSALRHGSTERSYHRTRTVTAAVAVTALMFGACGGEDDAETTTTVATVDDTTTTAVATIDETIDETMDETTTTVTTEVTDPEPDPSGDGPEVVWQVTYLDEFDQPEQAWSIAVSPDGERFASGHYQVTRIHHLADGELIDVVEFPHSVNSLAYSPDGSRLAGAATRGGALIIDTANTAEVIQIDIGWEGRLGFAPDGETLVAGGSVGGSSIEFHRVDDGSLIDTIELIDSDWLISLEYSPDGDTVAFTDLRCEVIWFDVDSGAATEVLDSPHEACSYATVARPFRFSPDGTAYARYLWEPTGRRVDVVEIDDGTLRHSFPIEYEIRGLSFTADGSLLAIVTQYTIEIRDTETGEVVHIIEQDFDPNLTDWNLDGIFTPDDGHLLISRWNGTELWRLPGAEVLVAPEREACDPIPIPGDVLFDTASAELRAEADTALGELADELAAGFATATLTFVGHTDSRGSAEANQQLSLERATATRDWFAAWATDNAVDGWILEVAGRGASEPAVIDTNAEGDFLPDAGAVNRRVEIIIDAPGCA